MNVSVEENMKKNDKFIGDLLATFEQSNGMKFNKFDKPEDPKYVEPKKKGNLKIKLKQAERKQKKLQKLDPEDAKNMRMKKAIEMAQGIKVKDDPKMIRKTIKKKQDEKKRHKKKWAERVNKLEETQKFQEKKKKERTAKSREQKGAKRKKGAKGKLGGGKGKPGGGKGKLGGGKGKLGGGKGKLGGKVKKGGRGKR